MKQLRRIKNTIEGHVYKQLVLDKRIPHGAFRLWHLLRDYAGEKMNCWPGQRRLCLQLGSNFKSIATWRRQLVECGWLEIEKMKNSGHKYHLRIPLKTANTATETGSATKIDPALQPVVAASGATKSGSETNDIKLNPLIKPRIKSTLITP